MWLALHFKEIDTITGEPQLLATMTQNAPHA
jgi:hypothetical protein